MMEIVSKNQLDTARSLKRGDMVIVEFEEFSKYRSFSVQLSYYNNGLARERNLYVHAASKMKKLQYLLYVVSIDERVREENDSNYKGLWKKQLPEEWWKA